MRKHTFLIGVLGVLALLAAARCGEPFTLTGSVSSAASSAGAGGEATSAGSGGTGGAGGEECTPGLLSTCEKGEYCAEDSTTCRSCDDFSRFHFGIRQNLGVTAPKGGSNVRFPRIGQDGELLFAFTGLGTGLDLAHAAPTGFLKFKGALSATMPINSAFDETAPFYLPKADVLDGLVDVAVDVAKPVLLFHRNVTGTKQVLAFNPGAMATSQLLLAGGTQNSHLTVSWQAETPRFFYMSDAGGGGEELVTAAPGGAPAPIEVVLDNGCQATGSLMPWVTPKGDLLLFASSYPDEASGCAPPVVPVPRLFSIPLDPDTGKPTSMEAQPIYPKDTKSFTTPSLSEDLCVLYFTEQKGTESELYGVVRN